MRNIIPSSFETLNNNLFFNKNGFSDYLCDLMHKKNLCQTDIYKRADITRQTWSNIYSGKTRPNEQTSRRLIIGLKCSIEEAEKLLAYCGQCFVLDSDIDNIIKECLKKQIYNFADVEMFIFQRDKSIYSKKNVA